MYYGIHRMLRLKLSTGYSLVELVLTSSFATCVFFCVVAKKKNIFLLMLLSLLLFFYEKIPKSVNVYWKSIKFVLPEWKICFWYNYCAYLQAPGNIEATPNPNRKPTPKRKTPHTLTAFFKISFFFLSLSSFCEQNFFCEYPVQIKRLTCVTRDGIKQELLEIRLTRWLGAQGTMQVQGTKAEYFCQYSL